jgi:hypothetical protein
MIAAQMATYVNIVAEGEVDASVARAILRHVGLEPGTIHVKGGKAKIDSNIGGYNHAAAHGYWLVLRDLNGDAPCAGELVRRLVPHPETGLVLRIPIRSVESWLFADAGAIGRLLGISQNRIPREPEGLPNPKLTLVHLAERSRYREVRDALVPSPRSGRRVGTGYSSVLADFVAKEWSVQLAVQAERSRSLNRAVIALDRIAALAG